jgi:hypothetical protein
MSAEPAVFSGQPLGSGSDFAQRDAHKQQGSPPALPTPAGKAFGSTAEMQGYLARLQDSQIPAIFGPKMTRARLAAPATIKAGDLEGATRDQALSVLSFLGTLDAADFAGLFGPRLTAAHLREPSTIKPAHLQGLTRDQASLAARYLEPADLQRACGPGVSGSTLNSISLSAFRGLSQAQALALLSFLSDDDIFDVFQQVVDRDMLLDPSRISSSSLGSRVSLALKNALLSFFSDADAARLLPGVERPAAQQVQSPLAAPLNAPEKLDGRMLSQAERDAFAAAWPNNQSMFPPGMTQAKLRHPDTITQQDFAGAGCTLDQALAALSFLSDQRVTALFGPTLTRQKLQSPISLNKPAVASCSADQAKALRPFVCDADLQRIFSVNGTPLARSDFRELSNAGLRSAITLLSDARVQAIFGLQRSMLLALPPSTLRMAVFVNDIAGNPAAFLPDTNAGWTALINDLASPPMGTDAARPSRAGILCALLQSDCADFAARMVSALPPQGQLTILDDFLKPVPPMAATLLANLFAALPSPAGEDLLQRARTHFSGQRAILALLPVAAHPAIKPPPQAPALSQVQPFGSGRVQIQQDGTLQFTGLHPVAAKSQCAPRASDVLNWDEPPPNGPQGSGQQQLMNRVIQGCITDLFGVSQLTATQTTDLLTRANDAGKTAKQQAQRRLLRALIYNQYTAATGRPTYPQVSVDGLAAGLLQNQLISAPNPWIAAGYGALVAQGKTQPVVQASFPPIPAFEGSIQDELGKAVADPDIQAMYDDAVDKRIEAMVMGSYFLGNGSGTASSNGLELAHAWLDKALQDFAAKAPPATPPLALAEIKERLDFIQMLAGFNKRYPGMAKTYLANASTARQQAIATEADKALAFAEQQRAGMAAAAATLGLLPTTAPQKQSITSAGIPMLANLLKMAGGSRHFLSLATQLSAWLGPAPPSNKTTVFAELMQKFFSEGLPKNYSFGNFDEIVGSINAKHFPPPFGADMPLIEGLRTLNKMGLLGTLSGLASLSGIVQTAVDTASKGKNPTPAEQAKMAGNIFSLLSVPNHYAKLFAPEWAAANHISSNPMEPRPPAVNPVAMAMDFLWEAGWTYTLNNDEMSLTPAELEARFNKARIGSPEEMEWAVAIFERTRQSPADDELSQASLRVINRIRARSGKPALPAWPSVQGAAASAPASGGTSAVGMPAAWRNMKPAFAFGFLTGAMDLAGGVASIVQGSLTLADTQGRASLPSAALANISTASAASTLVSGVFGAAMGGLEIAALYSTTAASALAAAGPAGWAVTAALAVVQTGLQIAQVDEMLKAVGTSATQAQALFSQVLGSMGQDNLLPATSVSYGIGTSAAYLFELTSSADPNSVSFSVSGGTISFSYSTSSGGRKTTTLPTEGMGNLYFTVTQIGQSPRTYQYTAATQQVTAISTPAVH